eukprot:1279612-Rhodomonas_salina.3
MARSLTLSGWSSIVSGAVERGHVARIARPAHVRGSPRLRHFQPRKASQPRHDMVSSNPLDPAKHTHSHAH